MSECPVPDSRIDVLTSLGSSSPSRHSPTTEKKMTINNAAAAAWTPGSWRSKPIKQAPEYPNQQALRTSVTELKRLPPIVHPREIAKLRENLRDVAAGDAFLLQGGDCAEIFDYCEQGAIESKIKLLLQMSLVLISGLGKRVVRIGRMAGQYAKPRSSPTETVNGERVPSFRGDILNGFEVDERELDPRRLVRAYHHAAATLNFIRAALASGIADLERPMDWSLGHVRDPALRAKYTDTVRFLQHTLSFMQTIGASKGTSLGTIDLFTSHEGLVLEYEESLTRLLYDPLAAPVLGNDQPDKAYFDTSAHFLWIGDRTRQLDHAHVEFFRGIANPIGVKIGPTTTTQDILGLLCTLNPRREPGKITLITRYGALRVMELLPAHIRAVEDSEFKGAVVWQCDPMHGNTQSVTGTNGDTIKTRLFEDILAELERTLAIHDREGSYLGGVHLELTGDAVTECLGGSEGLVENDLYSNYTSFCDPRLNEKQALELAFLIAGHFRTRQDQKTQQA